MEKIKTQFAGNLTNAKLPSEQQKSSKSESINSQPANQIADPQVKPSRYSQRRSFSPSYKTRILNAYNACPDAASRGSFLRQEGLYHSQICTWRNQQSAQKLKGNKVNKFGSSSPRSDHLARENAQLKKKLAQAEAIIDLQKKVAELFGDHILPHETTEVNS